MNGVEVTVTNTAAHTADTPQLLLEHHLKELRLPTILREYDKVSECRHRLLSQSTFRGVGMVSPEGLRQPFEKLRLSPQASHIPGFARSHESERIAHLVGLGDSGSGR